jgi:hypothetical protein
LPPEKPVPSVRKAADTLRDADFAKQQKAKADLAKAQQIQELAA